MRAEIGSDKIDRKQTEKNCTTTHDVLLIIQAPVSVGLHTCLAELMNNPSTNTSISPNDKHFLLTLRFCRHLCFFQEGSLAIPTPGHNFVLILT